MTLVKSDRPICFAFIIGAMKSGTTSLFDILSQHPQICPSRIKEPDYFAKPGDEASLERYLSLWDWRNDVHSIALESSVAYTKMPYITGVPERIYHAHIGQYKFIYMLRHPTTRIESQIRHGLFAGWGKSLDEGVPEDAIYFSSYAMQLDRYLEHFALENILLITLEEFKQHPHAVLSKICHFLQISDGFPFQNVHAARNSGEFFNASAVTSRITQSKFGQYLAARILPQEMKNSLRNAIARLSRLRDKPSHLGRWQLTSEERDLVIQRLMPDLQRLQSDYGLDIQTHWNIQSKPSERRD